MGGPGPSKPGEQAGRMSGGVARAPERTAFEVALEPPDLSPWLAGNAGVPGFMTYAAAAPGPHVVITSLVHGNEISGAVALDELLRGGVRPACGRLTVGFVNLSAFARFDPGAPTASRFVDEDLNRLWDLRLLDGPHRSLELDRAREIRPVIEAADILLDLHSMLWPSDPLILSGPAEKGRTLAASLGVPPLVIADHGHANGPRLIDHPGFTSPDSSRIAVLVEAGAHWQRATVATDLACIAALFARTGLASEAIAAPPVAGRCAEVTHTVTAMTADFNFLAAYRGGDIVPDRDTLIALDGTAEVRTPHDDCLLVMPSLRPSRGHTAVRLARLLEVLG